MSITAGYHHLKIEQRGLIMGLAQEGVSLSHIAERCHTSVSTVSRELSRQFPKEVSLTVRREQYSATAAQRRYLKVRENCGPQSKLTEDVRRRVERGLEKGFSPEQIANTDVREVSHVSIYSWLYKGFIKGGNRAFLRHKGKKRINRKDGQGKKYGVGKSIHDRPEAISSRLEFGHFEADSIESERKGKGCVFNFIERKTRKSIAYVSRPVAQKTFITP